MGGTVVLEINWRSGGELVDEFECSSVGFVAFLVMAGWESGETCLGASGVTAAREMGGMGVRGVFWGWICGAMVRDYERRSLIDTGLYLSTCGLVLSTSESLCTLQDDEFVTSNKGEGRKGSVSG